MNPILDFLKEIVIRLRAKSPLFFKILQWISAATALIAGLPVFIEYLGVDLPSWALVLESKTIAISAIISAFITGLPVDKPTVIVETDAEAKVVGKIVAKDVPSLPFTDKH
jgi:hypothetical protein